MPSLNHLKYKNNIIIPCDTVFATSCHLHKLACISNDIQANRLKKS